MNQPNQITNNLRHKVINFISVWQNDFILDYWWRKKYNVAFGSPEHLSMNFIDMYIEFQEEIQIKKEKEMLERVENGYEGNVPVSKKEIDDDYDNINLEEFNNG